MEPNLDTPTTPTPINLEIEKSNDSNALNGDWLYKLRHYVPTNDPLELDARLAED